MPEIVSNIMTLFMLVLLQAVLGFDNLLYISLESKRVEKSKQKMVRTWGIGLAVALRLVILFLMLFLMNKLTATWFTLDNDFIKGQFGFDSLITFFGGGFILYTAIKEVMHMATLEVSLEEEKKSASVVKAIALIVMMNAIFSFDSILGAMAITTVPWIMVTAIIISGILMIWLADRVSDFLHKNRMYEVLGLFILFIVGILLLSEAGHLAHLSFFGHEVEKMSKATFYFVIAVLVAVDIIQGRYQKQLLAKQALMAEKAKKTS